MALSRGFQDGIADAEPAVLQGQQVDPLGHEVPTHVVGPDQPRPKKAGDGREALGFDQRDLPRPAKPPVAVADQSAAGLQHRHVDRLHRFSPLRA